MENYYETGELHFNTIAAFLTYK